MKSRPRSPTSRGARSWERGRCWSRASHSAFTRGSIAAIIASATPIQASVSAQTLAHKPVAGKGTLKLNKISYDAERRPVETLVESWDLVLDADGQTHQAIKASVARPVPAGGDDR